MESSVICAEPMGNRPRVQQTGAATSEMTAFDRSKSQFQ